MCPGEIRTPLLRELAADDSEDAISVRTDANDEFWKLSVDSTVADY